MGSRRSQDQKVNPINAPFPIRKGPPNDDACPRHGERYVIRTGTNQCPRGRKLRVVCR